MNAIAERRAALFARTTTSVLVGSLQILETAKTEEERLTRAWICDELERRHPAVEPIMDAWSEDLDTPYTYSAALMHALRQVGAL